MEFLNSSKTIEQKNSLFHIPTLYKISITQPNISGSPGWRDGLGPLEGLDHVRGHTGATGHGLTHTTILAYISD